MRRILFWIGFIVVLGLIVWGLIAAMNKPPVTPQSLLGEPAPVSATDHVIGLATAPVTLIEYGDFQCPACSLYAPMVERLIASSSALRVVFRHFPLPQHTNAADAALASEAAASQGKFWEMYAKIYAGQAVWQGQTPEAARATFAGYAKELGLNMNKYTTDFGNAASKEKVRADLQEGVAIGVNSTPTFFVNGKAITNPTSYEQFKSIIDEAANVR